MTAAAPVNLEGGPQCYQHADWQDDAARKWHIRHGFFTANGGVSTGLYQSLNCGFGSNDDPALIAENRRRVANSLGFQPDQMFGLRQTHSARVVTIDSVSDASIDARADADALITNNIGCALAILTADCVPVLFAAPEMGVIGAAQKLSSTLLPMQLCVELIATPFFSALADNWNYRGVVAIGAVLNLSLIHI